MKVPVRLELLSEGKPARENWSRLVEFVVQDESSSSTNTIELMNGVAVVGFLEDGPENLQVTIQSGDLRFEKSIEASRAPAITVAGQLSGVATTWSGLVRITNDVIIPAGHTLSIEAGTVVLVDGVDSGTSAPDILIEGKIECLGTEENPIVITCNSGEKNWGQIRQATGSTGLYRNTFVTRGGRATGEGHTSTGPVFRLSGADVRLDQCVISDLLYDDAAVGKGMYARNSELVFDGTIFSHMRMGPEIEGTGLFCTNSYFMEMRGPDDCDGLYLHNSEGKDLRVTHSVFVGGDDDAIDTLDADVSITNCIFRGWLNENEDAKAISVFSGTVRISRCLIADCFSGISAKTSASSSARVQIDHATVVTKTNGIAAAWKSNAPGPNIFIEVTNCIVRADPAILSDFGTTNLSVGFSNLSSDWIGTGNTFGDPGFVNITEGDYRLHPNSLSVDAGDPGSPLDADGTRTDLGCYPVAVARELLASVQVSEGALSLELTGTTAGQTVICEISNDFSQWTEISRATVTANPYVLAQRIDGSQPFRFYRFRVE